MGVLTTTWKHVRRSPYQAIAAVLTMFLTLLLSGIFFLTSGTSVLILHHFEGKPQITVFFKDEATSENVTQLQSQLEATGKTSNIRFISQEDALEIYKEQNKEDPLLLEMVTADILPASLEISAVEPKFLAELEPVIAEVTFVEEVVYQRDIVETLINWTNATRLVVGALAILLAVDAILILIITTSMKIAIRREEIEILRLVGASRWYIRLPFIWEAGLFGLLGAVMGWAVITSVVLYIRPVLLTFLGVIPEISLMLSNPMGTLFILSSLGLLGILTFVGFFLGAFGSFIAVNRYLKV